MHARPPMQDIFEFRADCVFCQSARRCARVRLDNVPQRAAAPRIIHHKYRSRPYRWLQSHHGCCACVFFVCVRGTRALWHWILVRGLIAEVPRRPAVVVAEQQQLQVCVCVCACLRVRPLSAAVECANWSEQKSGAESSSGCLWCVPCAHGRVACATIGVVHTADGGGVVSESRARAKRTAAEPNGGSVEPGVTGLQMKSLNCYF